MPDLLFEIGCEELPHPAVASGEEQLGAGVAHVLSEGRLEHGTMETFATPRRLAVLVRDVAAMQRPAVEERRGPPIAQAYLEDGTPAPAAVGFARANGVDPASLVSRDTPAGEYLFIVREIPGSAAQAVLPDMLAGVLTAMQFHRSMRWEASKARFARPVRWLVALLDDEVLPVSFAGVEAGRTTHGHRLVRDAVELASPGAYERTLEDAGVVVRRVKRRHTIRTAADAAARGLGGRAVVRDAVLDEVTDLVERPTPAPGRFDDDYLKIPREVLVTVLESHQRTFPVEDDAGRLMAAFVAISNGDPEATSVIAAGNERVVRARLEDAKFFFEEDTRRTLSERTGDLADIVVHPRLGTMRDKVLRIGVLLGEMARWLELSEEDTDVAFAAADVCKADRTTRLVFEFPELQGRVGREYALLDRDLADQAGPHLERVADAIRDHYRPRFADDELPEGAPAVALGLADRLDTLVGYLGIGLTPTGSQDPYALRREAAGFAALCIARGGKVPLDEAIAAAREQYVRAGLQLEECGPAVRDLIVARAQALLEREGIRKVLMDAAAGSQWTDLPDLAARARALQSLHDAGRLHPLAVVFERCHNVSKDAGSGDVDEAAFVHTAEHDLFGQLSAVEEIAREFLAGRDYPGALSTLVPLAEVVAALFDAVLVNDPDEAIRRNRLALLRRTAAAFRAVADFSVISPPELQG